MLIEFPLPRGEERYGSIDGRKIHKYVVEQAAISKRYRDSGHPKYCGRIIGSTADTEDAEWLAGKMKARGLSDVHTQPFDLPPQWTPASWSVTMTSGGKTITLGSAQPAYEANALLPGGVELETVYVGLGAEADFMGRDVRGKAVFTYSMQELRNEGAVRRADEKGAAVIFDVSFPPCSHGIGALRPRRVPFDFQLHGRPPSCCRFTANVDCKLRITCRENGFRV